MIFCFFFKKKISSGTVKQRTVHLSYLTQERDFLFLKSNRLTHMITWDKLGQYKQTEGYRSLGTFNLKKIITAQQDQEELHRKCEQ